MEVQPEMEPTSSISLIAAVSYGIASMAMVFINKAVIMQYPHSMTVLTLQQLATSLLIHCGRRMGYTRARGIDLATAKKLLPVSIFYNANVAFALASLKGVNIPMYIAIKRLTPLAVLIAGYLFGKGKPTTQVALSVLLTAAGCVIAALGDFSFDLFGYGLALTSVFFQTMYLVLVEKSGAEDGLSSIEIMFYNSFLSLPFLSFLIIVTGEFPNSISLLLAKSHGSLTASPKTSGIVTVEQDRVSAKARTGSEKQVYRLGLIEEEKSKRKKGKEKEFRLRHHRKGRPELGFQCSYLPFLVMLVLSLVMGIVLNFTMFLCTIVNSALTTTIVGVLKGVGSTTLGFVLLGGVEVHALNVSGLVVNTAGGVWYSYAKYRQKKAKPAKTLSDLEAHKK
uniref:Sugar phosphate transporter domain-containing protein n=1 Tax=Brassica campestris TaxID=3711 RepID=M4D180_BRACM